MSGHELIPSLRDLTTARVGLARTGASLTTEAVLDFSLCHAQARDAVHATLSVPTLLDELRGRGLDPVAVHTRAQDRRTYLLRPDLGRALSDASAARLRGIAATEPPRLTLILADGLSALAADRHAIALLDALLPLLQGSFQLTPVIVAEQARVALGDQIGEIFASTLTVVLIGERPGLSSPDSLGAYITFHPRVGRSDAERNCVSNIRTQGLDYATAAARIAYLCLEAQRRGLTGTQLKEAAQPEAPRLKSEDSDV